MCSLLCNFNCYCTLGASLMLALSAIDVSLHYYYMQNFHRKKKEKKTLPNLDFITAHSSLITSQMCSVTPLF